MKKSVVDSLLPIEDRREMSKELILQLYPTVNEIELAIRKLPRWMKSESRARNAILTFKFVCEYTTS